MQSLRRWGVIDQLNLQDMSLSQLEAGKLNDGGGCAEKSVRTNGIKSVVHAQVISFFSFSLR